MASVGDVVKARLTHSGNPEMTVLEAARMMTERNIGALPVLREGRLVGIFSERDVMTRVVAAGRSPGSTKLSEVMTSYPRTVAPEETVENCLFMMKEFGFRHLPICAGEDFVGLVSVRDLMLYDHRARPA
ncbi:MAG TPA: CBS domain-containing protein [Terriglobales bacterium]|nr:CBS domain-containing protein [Terriglobales bacterium]